MRIMLTGVHGTGKTTLINSLKDWPVLADYKIVTNMTRELANRGFIINKSGDDATQLELMKIHLENLEYENVIMDRSLIDYFAYTLYLNKNHTVSMDCRNKMREGMLNNIKRYDIIFYLVPEFPIVVDEFRPACEEFQTSVAELYESIINTYNIDVIKLTGTVEQRMEVFKKEVCSWLYAYAII